ncbi:putative Mnd1 family [Trypanosoma vivax]|uniref:Mnd1 HTH domain-containing protein n=1 Tax=Trypanosoma vivax (strain Y486) TaxID=1055687 RepID=G0UBB7_TRYVY|nr:putative Mnd1 family [Trypanosoma vivax]CCC53105.1 conserved hypothetical protein [Trypanosoma vivax Y486]
MHKTVKKKGLSMEEKVARIEEWFQANPVPYTLKDLLALLPRATGVIPQSVEECLEVLVSEDRVRQKKVGIHVLFWRFPQTPAQQLASAAGAKGGVSEAARYLGMTLEQLQEELVALRNTEVEMRQQLEEMCSAIGDSAAVRNDTERIAKLRDEVKSLEGQLKQLGLFDPDMIERIKSSTLVAWESANRWTDNMFLLEQHITKRMGVSSRDLRAQLQLPQNIEYIEESDLLPPACEETTQSVDGTGRAFSSPLMCDAVDVDTVAAEEPSKTEDDCAPAAYAQCVSDQRCAKSGDGKGLTKNKKVATRGVKRGRGREEGELIESAPSVPDIGDSAKKGKAAASTPGTAKGRTSIQKRAQGARH